MMITSGFKTNMGGGVASHSKCFGGSATVSQNTIESSLQGGEQDFLVSDSELRNLRGGSSRRENERPTPINLSKSLISQQIGYSVECTRKSNFRKAQIDFLPSPLGEGRKKAAFTLAEVLITLGIIGVVAALTLPTLISNYQKQVYVNQLKKSYSMFSQGFTTMMGQDGVTQLTDTEAFAGMTGSSCSHNNMMNDGCKNMRDALEKIFTNIKFSHDPVKQEYTYLNLAGYSKQTQSYRIIEFPDGSYITKYSFEKNASGNVSSTMKGRVGYFELDINGFKGPNVKGRDRFSFFIGNTGIIYPQGSMAVEELGGGNGQYWKTTNQSSYNCNSTNSSGGGCAARVLEEGKMDY